MATPDEANALVSRATNTIGEGLVSFELVLYACVGLLLGIAGILILVGTVSGLVRGISHHHGGVNIAVLVLDRVLLALIVGELLYTLRFVVRTHEIAVEPFLYVGLIAVVRRILIVTAQFERTPQTGRALTNTLLEFGLLGLMVPALAVAVWLVRRSRHVEPAFS
ncbi:MAG TPA: phosphate-starvation-inducible PsiE family protein [Gaiellaceae bacterium]